jgi:hypothetical protein
MERLVTSPALPHLGLEPRYLRERRMPSTIAKEIETPQENSVGGAGPGVDGATDELRQRIVAAKPLAARRLPTSLAQSIAARLTALRPGEP